MQEEGRSLTAAGRGPWGPTHRLPRTRVRAALEPPGAPHGRIAREGSHSKGAARGLWAAGGETCSQGDPEHRSRPGRIVPTVNMERKVPVAQVG